MRKVLIPLALFSFTVPLAAEDKPEHPAPLEIVAASPKADWAPITASDLMVMDLAADAKGRPRRVVIQLLPPPFSQGWVGNIRKLVAARFWDGTSINRVQDNYVVQWGDAEAEDTKKAKPLPPGLATVAEKDYVTLQPYGLGNFVWGEFGRELATREIQPILFDQNSPPTKFADANGREYGFVGPFPFQVVLKGALPPPYPPKVAPVAAWPVHCYGMVGVGRDMPPNTGNGAELYTVIGHAPRQLDRNIALVGRVIEGIEHLSSLPRGKGALGFYDPAQGDERVPILSVRIGSEVSDLPAYEYLSTESASFAKYAHARANRRDPFYIQPAGGADICNIPVPVRQVK